jgi:hypothetical protein
LIDIETDHMATNYWHVQAQLIAARKKEAAEAAEAANAAAAAAAANAPPTRAAPVSADTRLPPKKKRQQQQQQPPPNDDDDDEEGEEEEFVDDAGEDAVKPRRVRLSRRKAPPKKKSRIRRKVEDSSSDTDLDDEDVIIQGQRLAKVNDLADVYPLLNGRVKGAVKKGMKKMVAGNLNKFLDPDMKSYIYSKRKDFDKVTRKGRKENPFSTKRNVVGKAFTDFVGDMEVHSSDSDDDNRLQGLDWSQFKDQ